MCFSLGGLYFAAFAKLLVILRLMMHRDAGVLVICQL